jgi:hypothetical protein
MTDREHTAADEYQDGNERDVEIKQTETVSDSEGVKQDTEIDEESISVTPGTGGPDDGGDVKLDPADYHPEG